MNPLTKIVSYDEALEIFKKEYDFQVEVTMKRREREKERKEQERKKQELKQSPKLSNRIPLLMFGGVSHETTIRPFEEYIKIYSENQFIEIKGEKHALCIMSIKSISNNNIREIFTFDSRYDFFDDFVLTDFPTIFYMTINEFSKKKIRNEIILI